MSERVLVTGGAGFIGSHTVDRLLEREAVVRVLDRLHPQVHPGGAVPAYLSPEAELMVGDVRDLDAMRRAVRGVDRVVHYAAETSVGQSMYRSDVHVDVNARGTATLFRALREEGVEVSRVVISSSRAVYGEGTYRCPRCGVVHPGPRRVADLEAGIWGVRCPTCGEPVTPIPTAEDAPCRYASAYGMTKAYQEDVARVEAAQLAIPLVVLRCFNAYGPRQSLHNPYMGLIGTFALRLLRDRPVVLYERGTPIRDLVHVTDLVDASVRALLDGPSGDATLNVGSGAGVTLTELAMEIGRAAGRAPVVEPSGRFRVGDIHAGIARIDRIRDALGWEPRIALAEGLGALIPQLEAARAPDRSEAVERELRREGVLRG
jgi:dTDP-L-rhamnose 4-epimerase